MRGSSLLVVALLTLLFSLKGMASGASDLGKFESLGEVSVSLKAYRDTAGGMIYYLEEKEGRTFYAPGNKGVANVITTLSNINVEKTELYYRTYPIENLINFTYPQIMQMLIEDKAPEDTPPQGIQPKDLPKDLLEECKHYSRNSDPIIFMQKALLALEGNYNQDQIIINTLELMPTLFAYAYRHKAGKSYIAPSKDLTYEENLLYMMFEEEFLNDPLRKVKVDMARILLILHAEHSTNASTASMRNTKSSGSSFIQCLNGALGNLSGSKHGGANRAALKMYREKIQTKENIPAFLKKVRDKEEVFMGMGHRVYNGPDPRYALLMSLSDRFFEKIKPNPLLEVAKEALAQAQADSYFASRGIYPNIDSVSWAFMEAIGISEEIFIPFFALSRTAGWSAHYLEEKGPIFRPSAILASASNTKSM